MAIRGLFRKRRNRERLNTFREKGHEGEVDHGPWFTELNLVPSGSLFAHPSEQRG